MNFTLNDTVENVATGAYAVLFVVVLPVIIPCWLIGVGLKKLGFHPSRWGWR